MSAGSRTCRTVAAPSSRPTTRASSTRSSSGWRPAVMRGRWRRRRCSGDRSGGCSCASARSRSVAARVTPPRLRRRARSSRTAGCSSCSPRARGSTSPTRSARRTTARDASRSRARRRSSRSRSSARRTSGSAPCRSPGASRCRSCRRCEADPGDGTEDLRAALEDLIDRRVWPAVQLEYGRLRATPGPMALALTALGLGGSSRAAGSLATGRRACSGSSSHARSGAAGGSARCSTGSASGSRSRVRPRSRLASPPRPRAESPRPTRVASRRRPPATCLRSPRPSQATRARGRARVRQPVDRRAGPRRGAVARAAVRGPAARDRPARHAARGALGRLPCGTPRYKVRQNTATRPRSTRRERCWP